MIGRKVKYLKMGYYIEEDGEILIVPGYNESEAISSDGKFHGIAYADLEFYGEYVAFNAKGSTVALMTENGLLKTVGSLQVRILKENYDEITL